MSDEAANGTYRDNYRVLRETAEWLSKPGEPDIDLLVPKVEAAMKAYQVCKDRIETVRAKLNTYFDDSPEQTGDGEQVDEPVPDRPGVAPFMQIVEPRYPAAIGEFVFNFAI